MNSSRTTMDQASSNPLPRGSRRTQPRRVLVATLCVASVLSILPVTSSVVEAAPLGQSAQSAPGGQVLSSLLSKARSEKLSPEAIKANVVALGKVAIPAVLDVLDAGHFYEKVGGNGQVVHALVGDCRAGLLLGLGGHDWEPVKRQVLSRLKKEPTRQRRTTALAVFGAALPGGELPTMLDLLADLPKTDRRVIRASLAESIHEICRRSPEVYSEIPGLYSAASPAFADAIIKGVRMGDDGPSFACLTTLIDVLPGADPILLMEIADLAKTVKRPVASAALKPLRAALRSPEHSISVEAVKALGRADDVVAIPALIEKLSSSHAPMVREARAALERLSAERFGTDAGGWAAWHGGALRWLDGTAPGLLNDLRTGDLNRTNRALLQLARYRVFRHKLVGPVAALTARANDESQDGVTQLACAVLGHFATDQSISSLLRALDGASVETRKAALDGLVRATGVNHGELVADWEAAGWQSK